MDKKIPPRQGVLDEDECFCEVRSNFEERDVEGGYSLVSNLKFWWIVDVEEWCGSED